MFAQENVRGKPFVKVLQRGCRANVGASAETWSVNKKLRRRIPHIKRVVRGMYSVYDLAVLRHAFNKWANIYGNLLVHKQVQCNSRQTWRLTFYSILIHITAFPLRLCPTAADRA